ncbi:unnamed protein product [Tuber aestivum]|uniref:Restriction endonuclease domain-containing protein n=1 Tax=Tuber aestivum TaxID=59557 RepID=A0A292PVY6_9PEZI|nr:unnamed protein product [Tuber aestivum]
MTPDELSDLLLQDEYLVLDIPAKAFPELEKLIGTRAYTYWPAIGRLTVKMTTQMHGTVTSWASELIAEGVEKGAFDRGDIDLIGKGRLRGFSDEYENITKVPDVALVPGECSWPTVAFEFGYAEPYNQLKEDAKLLLEGSEGQIAKVIVIKLEPLQEEETEIQKGFVEVWQLRDGVARKEGQKKNLFPLPRSHEAQSIMLSLGDILGDSFERLANQGWSEADTLVLRFDALRKSINKATRRHLIQEGLLVED